MPHHFTRHYAHSRKKNKTRGLKPLIVSNRPGKLLVKPVAAPPPGGQTQAAKVSERSSENLLPQPVGGPGLV